MTTVPRIFNLSPGPATLPEEVLEQAQQSLLSLGSLGMGILEISHRSKEFEAILAETEADLRGLLGLSSDWSVLFTVGGATLQFSMVPMNLLRPGATCDYVVTGEWAQRAVVEAQRVGQVHIAGSTESERFCRIPRPDELHWSEQPAYVHTTSNNTIYGTQWHYDPDTRGVPLVCDMSSDFLSRPIDTERYSLIYAGAQKNAGPAGVTVVLLRKSILHSDKALLDKLPILLNYRTYLEHQSLYNTPPVFAIYIVHLVLKWLKKHGGLSAMAAKNREKAALVYQALDAAPGFYRCHATPDSRSLMNITFRLPTEALDTELAKTAQKNGLHYLKGHRLVGGLRASLYNAFPLEGAKALAALLTEFARTHG